MTIRYKYKEHHPNEILRWYINFFSQNPKPEEWIYNSLLDDLEEVYTL